MAIMLGFRKRALLPSPWLSEVEWHLRFRKDLPQLSRLLDESGHEMLQTLGGFRYLVQQAIYVKDSMRICRDCKTLLPMDAFRLYNNSPRPECVTCERRTVLKRRRGSLVS